MEAKANYILVGFFSLLSFVGVVIFLMWAMSSGHGGAYRTVRIVFDRQVTGLEEGSSVLFNGIMVGYVSNLYLDPEVASRVIVEAKFHEDVPLTDDSSVNLGYQGLTGLAKIEIVGGKSKVLIPLLVNEQIPTIYAQKDSSDIVDLAREIMPQISAAVSKFNNLLDSVGSFGGVGDVFKTLNDLLSQNEASLKKSLKYTEEILGTIAQNAGNISEIIVDFQKFTENLNNVSGALEQIITGSGVDGADVSSMFGDVSVSAKNFRALSASLLRSANAFEEDISNFAGGGLGELRSFATEGKEILAELRYFVQRLDRSPQRFFLGESEIPEYSLPQIQD